MESAAANPTFTYLTILAYQQISLTPTFMSLARQLSSRAPFGHSSLSELVLIELPSTTSPVWALASLEEMR